MPKGFSFPSHGLALGREPAGSDARPAPTTASTCRSSAGSRTGRASTSRSRSSRRSRPRSRRKSAQQVFNGHFEVVPMAAGFIGDDGTHARLDAARRGRLRAADRLRQRLEPPARALGLPRARDDGALGARREPRPPRAAHAGRGLRDQRDRDARSASCSRPSRSTRCSSQSLRAAGRQPELVALRDRLPGRDHRGRRGAPVHADRGPAGGDSRLAALARLAVARRRPHGHRASRSAGSPGASSSSRWRSPACCSASPR